jgi:hypothetical protein
MCPSASAQRALCAVAILTLAISAYAPFADAADVDMPVVLSLVGVSGEMASLDHRVIRHLVTDFAGGDPVVSPVETGFQLDFTPTLLGGGRVAVMLELSVAFLVGPIEKRSIETPEGKRKVQEAELISYLVSSSFEVADGETVALDPVPAGPPILATPRIIVPGEGAPTMVQIEVRVPFGGHEVQLDALRLLKQPRVFGVAERQNSLRHLTQRTLVTGVVLGEAVTTRVESGSELDVVADVTGGPLGLDLGVRCRILDRQVPTLQVRTPYGSQKVQLPVLRTLHVDTRADVMDGSTIVLAGVQAGETEALVFVTPRLSESDGLQNVLLEARVVIAGGELKKPKGKPGTSVSAKDFELTGWEGAPVALAQSSRRELVSGYEDGEPVTSPVETGARLEFTPTALGGDDVTLEIGLRCSHLDPTVADFPVKLSGGSGRVDLPTVHVLELDTAVAAESGQTLVVGGILREGAHGARRERDEALVFATPQVGAGGDPDAVALGVRVVRASENEGPVSSSVERFESGPVDEP